ncbi:MAG: peptidoglycan DD-metalloendopeptidase family protein [Thermoleophilaceae bacterium]|nr:peptidoglycan DD-metalloendopeptidase family protein [Thermoleophilaceae bacterium]
MKSRFWATLLLGLMAYVVLPLPGLSAPLNKRIDNQRAKVEKKKRKEGVLTSTISRYNNRIDGLQGDINGLQSRQRRIQATLDGKRAELLDARDGLERSRDRLVRLRADLAKSQRALSARLVEIYKSDEPDALTVVLEADGFTDLLDRAEFIDRISQQDQRIVRTVRRLKAEATKQEKQLESLEKKAEAAANVILARKNELVTSKSRLLRSQGTLAGARGERRAVLFKVRNSRQKAQDDLRSLEAANIKAQRALQGAGGQLDRKPTNGGPIKRGSGELIWPINGTISSPFGQRWGRLHAGIDLPASEGTPIRAADSGRVVLAAVTGGYGNYTCIQHTSSMSTCYAHQSRYGTSQGSSVSQGEVMGYVGNTGNSFGAHLHFEVRINGNPVDPMGYL